MAIQPLPLMTSPLDSLICSVLFQELKVWFQTLQCSTFCINFFYKKTFAIMEKFTIAQQHACNLLTPVLSDGLLIFLLTPPSLSLSHSLSLSLSLFLSLKQLLLTQDLISCSLEAQSIFSNSILPSLFAPQPAQLIDLMRLLLLLLRN